MTIPSGRRQRCAKDKMHANSSDSETENFDKTDHARLACVLPSITKTVLQPTLGPICLRPGRCLSSPDAMDFINELAHNNHTHPRCHGEFRLTPRAGMLTHQCT